MAVDYLHDEVLFGIAHGAYSSHSQKGWSFAIGSALILVGHWLIIALKMAISTMARERRGVVVRPLPKRWPPACPWDNEAPNAICTDIVSHPQP